VQGSVCDCYYVFLAPPQPFPSQAVEAYLS
jgi:hypothetical protein